MFLGVLSSLSCILLRKRELLLYFVLSNCLISVSLPRSAMGRSAVFDVAFAAYTHIPEGLDGGLVFIIH